MTDHRNTIVSAAVDLLNDERLTVLERLALLREVADTLTHDTLALAVEQALDRGETWAAVGDALGLRSRQHAQQQWSRRLQARRLPH